MHGTGLCVRSILSVNAVRREQAQAVYACGVPQDRLCLGYFGIHAYLLMVFVLRLAKSSTCSNSSQDLQQSSQ